MRLRTCPATDETILAEQMVGVYRVQVFRSYGEPVYRLLVETIPGIWQKVCCFTRSDERRYPRRAALAGSRLVDAVKRSEERGNALTLEGRPTL
jgi:hypothetical protein